MGMCVRGRRQAAVADVWRVWRVGHLGLERRRLRLERHADDTMEALEVQRVDHVAVAKELHVLGPDLARDVLGHAQRDGRVYQHARAPRSTRAVHWPSSRHSRVRQLSRAITTLISHGFRRWRYRRLCLCGVARSAIRRAALCAPALVEEHVRGVLANLGALDVLVPFSIPRDKRLDPPEAALSDVALVEPLDERVVEVQPLTGRWLGRHATPGAPHDATTTRAHAGSARYVEASNAAAPNAASTSDVP
eukprot:3418623-Pleurochrysis_carterae.AAC.2